MNNLLEIMGYLEITENTKNIIKEHLEKNKYENLEEKIIDTSKINCFNS